MLSCKHVLQRQHRPCLTRLFTTKANPAAIKNEHKPVKSIEDKDGITEVYIVHRSKNGRKKKPLSLRLQALTGTHKAEIPELESLETHVPDSSIETGGQKWTSIPNQVQYERKIPIVVL